MYNKIGEFEFIAEPFKVDYTGHLTFGALGNHMLNCAGMHADQRGFGISMLNDKNNCTWVLSRMVIELSKMPYQYEKFTIETWVDSVSKFFTNRNFALFDNEGNNMGYAKSIWAMIDLESRKPMNMLDMHGGKIAEYALPDRDCPIEGPGRVRVKATEPSMSLKARYSDIDINGHFNSMRYIEHILDLFPLENFKESRIRRFEIAFVTESHYGDTLDYYLDDNGDNQYAVEIKNQETGESVCRSLVVFS